MSQAFDLSKYRESFTRVVDDFTETIAKKYRVQSFHIAGIQDAVKISCHLQPESESNVGSTTSVDAVVLLYHNKEGIFTAYNLENEANLVEHYALLPSDIQTVLSKHVLKRPAPPTSTGVNVFDEVLKRLEMSNCSEITTGRINNGTIFKGLYENGTWFEFNVYVLKNGQLNRKSKNNPVWNKPKEPPTALKRAIDQVIEWVKRVEMKGGRRAAPGPVSLASDMAALDLKSEDEQYWNVDSKPIEIS